VYPQELDNGIRSFLADASQRIDELKELIKAQSQGQYIDQQAHNKVGLPCGAPGPALSAATAASAGRPFSALRVPSPSRGCLTQRERSAVTV
jgi:hypothetical protein